MLNSLPPHIRTAIKVDDDTGCWLWQLSKSSDGYGWTSLNSKTYQAHRLVYKLLREEPSAGFVIDHLCRCRHCVNPNHMELVTPAENLLRSPLAPSGQRHCLKCGGAFSMVGKTKPQRRCLACAKKRRDEYRKENKERIKETQLLWNAANPEKIKAIQRRSDAKRRGKVA